MLVHYPEQCNWPVSVCVDSALRGPELSGGSERSGPKPPGSRCEDFKLDGGDSHAIEQRWTSWWRWLARGDALAARRARGAGIGSRDRRGAADRVVVLDQPHDGLAGERDPEAGQRMRCRQA